MWNAVRGKYINPNDLLSILHSINPTIQFTMEYSKDAFPFLGILIKCNSGKIGTDIYDEPTEPKGAFLFLLITLNIANRI